MTVIKLHLDNHQTVEAARGLVKSIDLVGPDFPMLAALHGGVCPDATFDDETFAKLQELMAILRSSGSEPLTHLLGHLGKEAQRRMAGDDVTPALLDRRLANLTKAMLVVSFVLNTLPKEADRGR